MSNPLSGVRADQTFSYRLLEDVANYIRHHLKYPDNQPIDTLRVFEDLHEISIKLRDGTVVPFRGGVIDLDSEGYTRYDRQKHIIEMLASEQTYNRLEEGHPRAGYFVAHELGHCLLHSDQLVRLAQMPTHQQAAFHRGRTDHKPYEDTEWQANSFASALLMPARGIYAIEQGFERLTPSLVAVRFGVSTEAAGYRLELYQRRRNELLD
jgi:Zn-dependent peptidase ImmA (M78 family)